MSSIKFGKLEKTENRMEVVEEKSLSHGTIEACPNVIFDPNHYHDGSCDCFDITMNQMAEWGYVWNEDKKHWGG